MTQCVQQAGFTEEIESERRREWHWPKTNPEAIQVRESKNRFFLLSEQLALRKEEIKRKKRDRLLKIIDACQ